MPGLMDRLKHAFAVEPPGAAEPTPRQQPAIDWICLQIARRRLTTPGLIALEMTRPLNFLASQALHVGRPGVWALTGQRGYADYVGFAEFLEQRGSMEYLARRVEHFEQEMERLEREGRPIRPFIQEHLDRVRAAADAAAREESEARP